MGFSQRGPARTLADRVDDLDAVLAALDVTGPVVTAGHDWGGAVSLGWAVRHRDRLRAVVLANTAVHQPAGAAAPSLIRLARTPALRHAVCGATPMFVRATTALSRPALPAAVRDAYAAPYATADRRRAVEEFVADIPLEPDHVSAATLDEIAEEVRKLDDVPALLLWGPRDPVFSDRYLRDLRARLPHADVQRYERASHLVLEDAPEAAADAWAWIGEHVPDRHRGADLRRTADAGGERADSRQAETRTGDPLWTGARGPRRRPLPRRRGAGRAVDLVGPARPAGARAGRRARRARGGPRRPGRAARPARRRPDRRRARLLAGRGVRRGGRPRAGCRRARAGPARRAPRARRRRPSRPHAGGRAGDPGQPDRDRAGPAGAAAGPRLAGRAGGARPAGTGAAGRWRGAPGRGRAGRRGRGPVHLRRHRSGEGRRLPAPAGAGAARGPARGVRDHRGRPARRRLPAVRALRPGARDPVGRAGGAEAGRPHRRGAGPRRRRRRRDDRLRLPRRAPHRRRHRRRARRRLSAAPWPGSAGSSPPVHRCPRRCCTRCAACCRTPRRTRRTG